MNFHGNRIFIAVGSKFQWSVLQIGQDSSIYILDIKYSPKITHVQEVLAPHKHSSGEKKLIVHHPQEVRNARRSKSYPQEATRSYESYHKPKKLVYSSWLKLAEHSFSARSC